MKTVVFDLDGTLADTSADLVAAANACFRGMGEGDLLDPVADALTAFQGGRAMLRLGLQRIGRLDEAQVDRQYPVLLDAYEGAIDRHTRLYPGARRAVESLRDAGFRIGICTNKPERLALILLDRLGLAALFPAVVGADTLPVRKPDPRPLRETVRRAGGTWPLAMLVGDTETDLRTARAAEVPVALVSFGPEGRGIARLKPDALFDHYDELGALVARLLGTN